VIYIIIVCKVKFVTAIVMHTLAHMLFSCLLWARTVWLVHRDMSKSCGRWQGKSSRLQTYCQVSAQHVEYFTLQYYFRKYWSELFHYTII